MSIRTLTTTGAWALGDQLLSSATNFAVVVVVARAAGPAGYGSFTLAFGSWTLLLGATRSMLVQPYTVAASGASLHDWRHATRTTAAAVLAFGVAFGIVAVGVGSLLDVSTPTGSAFVALGLFAAPLALQDFWRFAAFSQRLPRVAAFNDGMWAVVQAVSLTVLVETHTLTPATAIGSWGLGALAGALFGLKQFRMLPSLGARERQFIRKNAALAGWFGVSNVSYQAGSYGTVLLVGAGAGRAALGGLGSAVNLMAPARLVASASESIMLPNAVAVAIGRAEPREALRRLCKRYSIALATFFALAGAVLILVGPLALRSIFGTDYLRFSPLVPPVVATTTVSGLSAGFVLGVRALGEGRRLAALQAASAAAQIAIVAVSLPFGIVAVAWGLSAAEMFRTALAWVTFEKALSLRSDGAAPGAGGGDGALPAVEP